MFGIRKQLLGRKFTRNLNLFQVFSDSVKRQVEENKDFKKKLEQIGDSTSSTSSSLSKNAEIISKSIKNASGAMSEQTKIMIEKLDPILTPISRGLDATAIGIQKTYTAIDETVKPLQQTEAYKSYRDAKRSIISSALEITPKGERVSKFTKITPLKVNEEASALQTVVQPKWSPSSPKWFNLEETEQGRITRYDSTN